MAETYYALTEIVKLIDNLIAAMPTSFYNGIMAVRGSLVTAPAADVVSRDCYDRLLVENDELRKERPVVRCGECKLYGGRPWENGKTGICARTDFGVAHDDFCSYGLKMDMVTDCNQVKDGDGDV